MPAEPRARFSLHSLSQPPGTSAEEGEGERSVCDAAPFLDLPGGNPTMFRNLLRFSRTTNSTRRRPGRSTFRPSIESLEGRTVLSTFHWYQSVDGDFGDASRWRDQNNNPGVPGPNDDASIPGSINVTSSVSRTVNSLSCGARFEITGGTFTIKNVNAGSWFPALVVDQGAGLQTTGGWTALVGSTVAGTLDVSSGAGLRFLRGDNTLNPGASLTGLGQFLEEGDVYGGPGVHLNTDLTAPAHFLLRNGILDGAGTLTIAGTFDWLSGGAGSAGIASTGVTNVQAGATLNIGGSNGTWLSERTLNNAGTVNLAGTSNFSMSSGAVINNLAGAHFNVQSDVNLYGNVQGTINNAGTFVKTSPVNTGTTVLDLIFNNTGSLAVQSGTLYLDQGGTHTGAFNVPAGATLDFSQGTHTFNAGSSLGGAGQYALTGGTMVANANLSLADFTLDGGYLDGPATVAVTNDFEWASGQMQGSGVTSIPAGATLHISGTAWKNLEGRTINNAGTTNWTDAGSIGGNAGVFNNLAGGKLNLQGDGWFGGNKILNNAGTVTKTSPVGSGETLLDCLFNNTGTVNVQSGNLELRGKGTAASTFSAAAGSQVRFSNDYTLNAGAKFTGAGMADLLAGSLNVNGAVTATHFEQDGGALTGTGGLTATSSYDWTAGTIANPLGSFAIPAGGVLRIRGNLDKSLDGRTLNLSGKTYWTDSGNLYFGSGATINNKTGATFFVQNDKALSGGGTFNNSGLLTKTGGTATSTIGVALSNAGRLEVHAGTVNVTGAVAQVAGTSLNGGTWTVFGSPTVFATLSFASAPSLTALGAATTVTLSGVHASFSNLAGLASNAGALSLLAGQTFTTAGNFTNTGTLTLGAGSILTVNGSFNQSAAGTLKVAIAYTGGSFKLGRITTAAGGSVTLGGTLALSESGTPAVGSAFTLVQNGGSASPGSVFAGLPEGATIVVNGQTYKISYAGGDGNDVVLTRVA
jgi:hypothetical protein